MAKAKRKPAQPAAQQPRPLGGLEAACIGLGVLAATALLLNVLWETAMGLRAMSWPTAPGRIVAASFVPGDCRTGKAQPDFRYRFQVAGTEVEGQHLDFVRGTCLSQDELRQHVQSLPVGTPVTVRHHPDDPREAVLDGRLFSPATGLKAVLAALVWAGLVGAVVRRRRLVHGTGHH
ncbi:MAG: hypothetical protein RJA10_3932 [Pseudomonadota bacterium]|jgi:hypothetical protein